MSSDYTNEAGWMSAGQNPTRKPLLSGIDTGYGTIESERADENKTSDQDHGSKSKYHDVSPPSGSEDETLYANSDGSYNEESKPASLLWREEIANIVVNSLPMMLAMLLQTSIQTSAIFSVGRLGATELGAVSLASMTATLSGYAVYQGFAISLDTLCPQAYGAGNYHLVGLHMQRMTLFLLILTIPIAVLWLNSTKLIILMIPHDQKDVAELAGLFLRITLLGAPGFACFETGKKFVQAQGMFPATLYVLMLGAPINAFMSWFFVWHLKWGFIGAPIAIAITNNLLPLFLALYVLFIAGSHCFPTPSIKILHEWSTMISLSVPTFLMLEACFLVWEIETLVSSYISPSALAAQSGLATIVSIGYQIGTAAATAGSTRVSNHVGAGMERSAKTAAGVTLLLGLFLGVTTTIILFALGPIVPEFFTADPQVLSLMLSILPIYASLCAVDTVISACNGIICAVGRPEVASWTQLLTSWGICLPLGLVLAFWAEMGLMGIWIGFSTGFVISGLAELSFVGVLDWGRALAEARVRNKVCDH